MNEVGRSYIDPMAIEKQLKNFDKQLSSIKNGVEKAGMVDVSEVKKFIASMESCFQSKGTTSVFTITKGTQDFPSLIKLIHFFQTSKAAQETLTPTMVSLFKSSLSKLKTSISRSSKKKIKKVEKVTKSEMNEKGKFGSEF